jgi:protoporphyrinogen oxidase
MTIGIIGAGISGTSAALRLAKQGHAVEIFQRESEVGGLIATFDLAGTRTEHFYHFLCAGDVSYFELCRELGLADRVRFTKPRTGFYYQGRCFPFTSVVDLVRFSPLTLAQRIRFGLFALEAQRRSEWAQLDELTAKPWLIDRLGRRAYEVIWEPLLTLKFGDFHDKISAAWVWHRIHRVIRSKGRMGYLEGGTGFLLDALTRALDALDVVIRPGTPVARILADGGRVCGLRLQDGSEHACDRVISTVPLTILADLLPPGWDEYAERLRTIQYIGVACLSFKLKRRATPYFWLNVHDDRVPFNGIIEYTHLNPMSGEHIVYVPYYVPTTHPLYTMTDETLVDRTWRGIRLIAPELKDTDLIASHVARTPFAQAICPTHFLQRVPAQRTPLPGLSLLDSVLLYPEDRTQSGSILKAYECARDIASDA